MNFIDEESRCIYNCCILYSQYVSKAIEGRAHFAAQMLRDFWRELENHVHLFPRSCGLWANKPVKGLINFFIPLLRSSCFSAFFAAAQFNCFSVNMIYGCDSWIWFGILVNYAADKCVPCIHQSSVRRECPSNAVRKMSNFKFNNLFHFKILYTYLY